MYTSHKQQEYQMHISIILHIHTINVPLPDY